MSLPASGPISMSMVNTEAVRDSNTADTQIAGGSTPAVGSLVKLYEFSGVDQTAPHALSEFYNATYTLSIGIYARLGNTYAGSDILEIYYSTDGAANWFYSGFTINSIACGFLGNLLISGPSTRQVDFSIRAVGLTETSIYYNGVESTSCPSNIANYCENTSTFFVNIPTNSSATTVALTAYIDGTGNYLGC